MSKRKKGAYVYVTHFSLFKSLTFLIVIEKTPKTITILFFCISHPSNQKQKVKVKPRNIVSYVKKQTLRLKISADFIG